jgi:HAD superfamily hydrolase (TIGR01509 family)
MRSVCYGDLVAGLRLRDRKCVLFDLDGTLVDTSPLHAKAYRAVLTREAPGLLASFRYAAIAGLTTQDGWRRLGFGEDTEQLARLVRDKRTAYRQLLLAGGADAMPGADDLLASLRRRRVRCHVVTSAARLSASYSLERAGLRDCIDDLIAAEDVVRGKPDPEPYTTALRRTGLAVGEVIVVEDADSGIDAALAAGLDVVRVHASGPDRVPCFASLEALRIAFAEAEPK